MIVKPALTLGGMMRQAYIGVKECGCVTAAMVDDEKTTAKEVAEFAKDMAKTGRKVQHVSYDGDRFPVKLTRCTCNGRPAP